MFSVSRGEMGPAGWTTGLGLLAEGRAWHTDSPVPSLPLCQGSKPWAEPPKPQQKAASTSSAPLWRFPAHISALLRPTRDPRGRFHLLHPQNHHAWGKNRQMLELLRALRSLRTGRLEVNRNVPDEVLVLHHSNHSWNSKTCEFRASGCTSPRIPHSSKKRFPLFAFLPARRRNPGPVSAMRGR